MYGDFLGDVVQTPEPLPTESLEELATNILDDLESSNKWQFDTHKSPDPLLNNWRAVIDVSDPMKVTMDIKNNTNQWKWLSEGTGLWGPSHSPIYSKSGNLMWFFATRMGKRIGRNPIKGINPEDMGRTHWNLRQTYNNIVDSVVVGAGL